MEPKEPEQSSFGNHGHMDEKVPILTIEEQGRFHLEEVRVVLD